MGKPKAPRRLEDNEARAVLRTIRISPQKLNLVAALIRGKKVAAALNDLEFSRKRIAGTVKKTLESAIAIIDNVRMLLRSSGTTAFRTQGDLKGHYSTMGDSVTRKVPSCSRSGCCLT